MPTMLTTQENVAAWPHFKQDCKQNRNRLINDAYCCQVMPGRKLCLSVLKGACRCEPWIEAGAGKKKEKKKGGGMFMLLIASPLPALSLSPPLLSHSLTHSLLHTLTQKNTHLLFRPSPSHSSASFPSPLLSNPPHPFLLPRLTKGSATGGARSF